MKTALLTLFFIPLALGLAAQNRSQESPSDTLLIDSIYVVQKITISGNEKTKESIITRELDIHIGDTMQGATLTASLEKNRQRVFNTGLFIQVNLSFQSIETGSIEVIVKVKERFYTYPLPILELADRNFNEWWQQRNRSLKRINVGVDLVVKNVRGRNETLRLKVQFGFTHKYEIQYGIPYLDKKQRFGLNYAISYSTNKQVAYQIDNHTLTYTDLAESALRKRFYTAMQFSYRNKFYQKQMLTFGYFNNNIEDTISSLNTFYYLNGRTQQQYFALRYTFLHDRRDIQYYPLKGYLFKADIDKLGLTGAGDINTLIFRAEYAQYLKCSNKFFLAMGVRQKLSFPTLQPFANYTAFGYNLDYVSGYELYVINGQHMSLGKINAKYLLFQVHKEFSDVKFKQVNSVPLSIFIKMHCDAGYVWDKNTYNPNAWANKYLMGAGLGLDFVTYYDLVFRVEYSYNLEREGGVFLHMRAGI